MPGVTNQFVSIIPDELRFQFDLEKQVFCDLKVANTTDEHVAFKVKTTSPKKYFVRPNTGVIQPWDSCLIRVTLQAQKEYPPDMQCKDKFLLQSTKVSQQTDIDELPPNTFTKESGKVVEDCKLRVVYIFPQSGSTHGEDGLKQSSDNMQGSATNDDNQALQRLRDEKDAAVRQMQQLQRDVERMKKQRSRKNELVFSFKSALYVALIGIVAGFLLNVWFSSPPTASLSSPPTPPTDASLSSPPTPTPPEDASSSPPTPIPRTDASSSSPPTSTPPTDEPSSSPPTVTPPTDESDESSSPSTVTPHAEESDESSSSPPTTTTPTDASSTPQTTTAPTDSEPSTPPTE
ncbi:vesicle-associated protein 2-1 [Heracleum sosnowskyi]|uniref:Vesicle-associated protein 2-1 n=1 Tax=Heracleum sosnowskyi TaxID=360622 RepID=A0AAD8HI40_9APIA|nr:vesicle-associated protein 2-1 [Heracleum sosnowskyi]